MISRFVSMVFKMLLLAFGLVFAVSLLLAALVAIVFSLLKWLATGKKPAPLVVLRRFQQFAPDGVWTRTRQAQSTSDVVDVDMREVKPDAPHLKSDKP